MAIYRYIVTVELNGNSKQIAVSGQTIQDEIDSNLESTVLRYGIEHFTVEPVSPTFGQQFYPGQGFVTAPNSPDGRYND